VTEQPPRYPQPEPAPWSRQHRAWVKRRIDDAAARAKMALGAHDVLIVAWFQDIGQPQFLHVQDGGTAPMPADQVYEFMAATVRRVIPGEDLDLRASSSELIAEDIREEKQKTGDDDVVPGSSTVQ
jgi:hypothetical protein